MTPEEEFHQLGKLWGVLFDLFRILHRQQAVLPVNVALDEAQLSLLRAVVELDGCARQRASLDLVSAADLAVWMAATDKRQDELMAAHWD